MRVNAALVDDILNHLVYHDGKHADNLVVQQVSVSAHLSAHLLEVLLVEYVGVDVFVLRRLGDIVCIDHSLLMFLLHLVLVVLRKRHECRLS